MRGNKQINAMAVINSCKSIAAIIIRVHSTSIVPLCPTPSDSTLILDSTLSTSACKVVTAAFHSNYFAGSNLLFIT